MLRPYRPGDWDLIHDSLQTEFVSLHADLRIDNCPHAATYELDGKPVAAGGVMPYWQGVGMGWIIANDVMRQHPFRFARSITSIFEYYIKPSYWRVESVVRLDRHDIHRLMTYLGFVPECIAKYYGPDRSHFIRYAWTRF